MSLWTPGGEHEVPDEPEGGAGAAAADPTGGVAFEDLTPEQQEQAREMAREMAEAQARIASVPAADVVSNHVMGFYELAAIHLSQDPPNFAEASVAIDAMTAVVEGLQGRLGEAEPTLRDSLSQLRMVFVQLQSQAGEGAGGGAADPAAGD